LNLSEALDLGICCVKEKKAIKEKATAFVSRPFPLSSFHFFFPNHFFKKFFFIFLVESNYTCPTINYYNDSKRSKGRGS
jgi:hypothetical protein